MPDAVKLIHLEDGSPNYKWVAPLQVGPGEYYAGYGADRRTALINLLCGILTRGVHAV
ncbi:hypothetical protein LCGC14_2521910 [marine sediment metagenome]|uniref:Uncharacterized protein n=1 Tax=marine sediment metagenome TaxID=412755 RepID=A0A0F9DPH7_9ZZZZ